MKTPPNASELLSNHKDVSSRRAFMGFWIPSKVTMLRDCEMINNTEEKVMAIIVNYHDAAIGRGCYVTNDNLATELNTTKRVVQKLLESLEKKSLISRRISKEKGRIIVPTINKALRKNVPVAPHVLQDAPPRPPGRPPSPRNKSHAGAPAYELNNKKQNKQSFANAQDSGGFFEEMYSISPYSRYCRTLHDSLLKKNLLQKSKFNKKSWEKSFRDLNIKDQFKKKRISKVLKWYCENIGKPYIPVAHSAKTFCSKFLQIEAAMKRGSSPNKVEVNKDLEALSIEDVDPIVKGLYKELSSQYDWRRNKEELLPYLNQSFEDYRTWFRKVLAVQKKSDRDFALFIERAKEACITFPEDFIWRWWCRVGDKLASWKSWEGSLKQFTFSLEHKDFISRGREWAESLDGDTSNWNKLIKKASK
jgi:DNA-binding MarR family transcriptional regulator